MTEKLYISLVIPVHNEEENVLEFYRRISATMAPLDRGYEIMFIDDGSTDNTAKVIQGIADQHVKIISFQKHFGKSAALACGFSNARGDIVITMDGDLQDDPKEIPRFIEALKSFDLVSGWKFDRKDPWTKTIPSRVFNFLARKITGIKIHDFNCGYKAYWGDVARNMDIYGEMHRYIPALARWKDRKSVV